MLQSGLNIGLRSFNVFEPKNKFIRERYNIRKSLCLVLEAEYGEDPSDQDQYGVDSEDDDLPKLLQSIKNLSKDLTLVERLAVL